MVRIGFTGTQIGMSDKQKDQVREILRDHCEEGWLHFHHGDCVGADAEARQIAFQEGYEIICHPPINEYKRAFTEYDIIWPAKPYLERNHDIVDECDLLIAAPKEIEEQLRSGTWATVRYARKQGKEIIMLTP